MSAYLVFAIGLMGLLVAGHALVGGAVVIGRRFGLTPTVIGLTIVAAGTSAPELAVFAQAVNVNDTELAVGSVVGSNIANILLVLGLVAALGTVRLESRVVRFDVPVMIGASLLFLLFAVDGMIGPLESLFLVAGIVVFIGFTVRHSRRGGTAAATEPVGGRASTGNGSRPGRPSIVELVKGSALIAAGAVGLMFAAGYVVSGAEQIAINLGVPELIVGLTVLALGTSAPEIVTSILAAVRGERELAVGNVVGSNIFNILLVLGLSGLFARPGIAISADIVAVDLPIMAAAAFACLPLLFWDHKLDRWEGLVFLAYYGAYTVFLMLTATEHGATETYVAAMVWFVAPITVLTIAIIVFRTKRGPGGESASKPTAGRPDRRRHTSLTSHGSSSEKRHVVAANRSEPKEAASCPPSYTNPLLMRPKGKAPTLLSGSPIRSSQVPLSSGRSPTSETTPPLASSLCTHHRRR